MYSSGTLKCLVKPHSERGQTSQQGQAESTHVYYTPNVKSPIGRGVIT